MNTPHQRALPRPSAHRARVRIAAAIAFVTAFSSAAIGADYSDPLPDFFLRGSQPAVNGAPTYPRWEGFYFGAQVGKTFGTADFGNASSSQIKYILANTELENVVSDWTTLPEGTSGTQSYGGFFGYNVQWGEVITGFEVNYNHMGINIANSASLGPLIVPGATQTNGDTVQYAITVASSASVSIHDIITARVRGGWTYDRFLPYGFAGLALGKAEVANSTSVTGTKTTTPPFSTDPITGLPIPGIPVTGALILPRNPQSNVTSELVYGFTAGLGVDVGILPNMFLRAEWEFVQFPNVSDFRVTANSVHAGLGLKF
jgi:outer membrane immunogenic protein